MLRLDDRGLPDHAPVAVARVRRSRRTYLARVAGPISPPSALAASAPRARGGSAPAGRRRRSDRESSSSASRCLRSRSLGISIVEAVVDVAAIARVRLRRALAAEALDGPVLGAGRDADALRAAQRRNLDVGAADRLGERDRDVDLEVAVGAALEDRRGARPGSSRRGRPEGPPSGPSSPLPASRIRVPSLTPAGTLTR